MTENRSWKLEGIRRAQQDATPERAAEQAAREFERSAIPIPPSLQASEETPVWMRKLLPVAHDLFRTVVASGPDGIPLRDVATTQRERDALKLLRKSGELIESTEPHDGKSIIVLRDHDTERNDR